MTERIEITSRLLPDDTEATEGQASRVYEIRYVTTNTERREEKTSAFRVDARDTWARAGADQTPLLGAVAGGWLLYQQSGNAAELVPVEAPEWSIPEWSSTAVTVQTGLAAAIDGLQSEGHGYTVATLAFDSEATVAPDADSASQRIQHDSTSADDLAGPAPDPNDAPVVAGEQPVAAQPEPTASGDGIGTAQSDEPKTPPSVEFRTPDSQGSTDLETAAREDTGAALTDPSTDAPLSEHSEPEDTTVAAVIGDSDLTPEQTTDTATAVPDEPATGTEPSFDDGVVQDLVDNGSNAAENTTSGTSSSGIEAGEAPIASDDGEPLPNPVGDATGTLPDGLGDTTESLAEGLGDTLDSVGDALDNTLDDLGGTTTALLDGAGDVTESLLQSAGDTTQILTDTLGDTGSELLDGVGNVLADTGQQLDQTLDTLGDTLGGPLDTALDGVGDALAGTTQSLDDTLTDLGESVDSTLDHLGEGLSDTLGNLGAGLNDSTDQLAQGVDDAIDNLGDGLNSTLSSLGDSSAATLDSLADTAGTLASDLTTTAGDAVDTLGDTVSDAGQTVATLVDDTAGTAGDLTGNLGDTVETLGEAAGSLVGGLAGEDLGDGAADLVDATAGTLGDTVSGLADSLADGSDDSESDGNLVTGLVGSLLGHEPAPASNDPLLAEASDTSLIGGLLETLTTADVTAEASAGADDIPLTVEADDSSLFGGLVSTVTGGDSSNDSGGVLADVPLLGGLFGGGDSNGNDGKGDGLSLLG